MKIFFLIICTFFINNNFFSQEKFNISVQYKLSYKIDSSKDEYKKENFILLANSNKGVYQSTTTYVKDSLLTSKNEEIRKTADGYVTDNNYYIIIEPSKSLITHYQPYENSKFSYRNDNKINWKLINETKEINGIKCKKATTHFLGRDWIAWFTEEYSFPLGPYKFYGLPGLIIEIHDVKNEYLFSAFKIKKYKNKFYELNTNTYINTDVTKFWTTFYNEKYKLSPLFDDLHFENESVIPTMKKNLEEKRKRENNPLELEH
ncbi:MAG: GLPGLI family protein [Bacteroidetes bacterium]|nr:GLPGLI family protein [Bacteroidota bacterium]